MSPMLCFAVNSSNYHRSESVSCEGGVPSRINYEDDSCTAAIRVEYKQPESCSSGSIYSCLASSGSYPFNYTSFENTDIYQYPMNTDKIAYIMRFAYSSSTCGNSDEADRISLYALNTCMPEDDGSYYYIAYNQTSGTNENRLILSIFNNRNMQ